MTTFHTILIGAGRFYNVKFSWKGCVTDKNNSVVNKYAKMDILEGKKLEISRAFNHGIAKFS